MADRTLNEISSATDFANAYTEDESGNQVKISKADMASVLAGIGGEVSITDFNEVTSPSLTPIFVVANAGVALNAPHTKRLRGFLCVLTKVSAYKKQIFFDASETLGTYIRNYQNNTWSDWKQIATL